jgi:type I site-specific restriction-modification system R (restriction) subunit
MKDDTIRRLREESWREKKIQTLKNAFSFLVEEDFDDGILFEALMLNTIHQKKFLGFATTSNDELLSKLLKHLANLDSRKLRDYINKLPEGLPKSELPSDKYLRSFELAKILNVSAATISIWVNREEFFNNVKKEKSNNEKRVHSKVLIPYSDIDVFISYNPPYKDRWEKYLKSGLDIF